MKLRIFQAVGSVESGNLMTIDLPNYQRPFITILGHYTIFRGILQKKLRLVGDGFTLILSPEFPK